MAIRFAWKIPVAGLVFAGLSLAPALWAQNSAASQTDQNSQSGQHAKITATGCLQKGTSGSGYQLTDQATNTTYDLMAANTSVDLSADVGQTVTVSGNVAPAATSSASNSSSTGNSSASGMEPGAQPSSQSNGTTSQGATGSSQPGSGNQQIQVNNVKTVSSSCQLPR